MRIKKVFAALARCEINRTINPSQKSLSIAKSAPIYVPVFSAPVCQSSLISKYRSLIHKSFNTFRNNVQSNLLFKNNNLSHSSVFIKSEQIRSKIGTITDENRKEYEVKSEKILLNKGEDDASVAIDIEKNSSS